MPKRFPAFTRLAPIAGPALLAFLALLAPPTHAGSPPPRAAPSNTARPVPPVCDPADFPAVLLPGRTALIKAKENDRVARVEVRVGDPVRKGKLLIQLVDDELRVARDRAAVLLEQAQADFDRAGKLQAIQGVSQEQYEKARRAFQLARADLDQATIRCAERAIRAPFDGVVAERYVDPGASVKESDPLVRVTALSPLRLEALLPQEMLSRVVPGLRVRVSVASPETTFWLPVPRRPRVVDPSSGMFPLQIEFDNRHGRLVPGVSCRVHLPPRGGGRP